MDGLLSLLLFAAFFYLMMRFGCGAHMVHGKHGNDSKKSNDDSSTAKHIDPVCGMQVDTEQGYGKMHDGQLYRFCSRSCLDHFEANPGQYLNPPAQGTGGEK
ncbi:MAG: YHS domain-containing protein [Planctomycetia bacterium]|nr:YHS domain-containing protein [Planctomycetia bacterium]